MPDTQIIGRVGIKVLPDTSNFRQDAKVKLGAIERKLEVKIPTKLDATTLQRQVAETVRSVNTEIKGKDLYKVKIGTQLANTTASMKQDIRRVVREYQTLAADQQVKINTKLADATGQIKLDLDDANLKETKQKIDHWVREVSPVKVPVVLDVNGPLLRATAARLAVLSRRRSIDLVPKLDKSALAKVGTALGALSGGRSALNIFSSLGRSIGGLDKAVPKIAGIALALGGVSAAAISAGGSVISFVGSLASIAPAALALPAIVGSLAIGLTATVVALKDTGKYVPQLGQAWKKIKATISDNFWDRAAKPIRSLVDNLLPEFVGGFKTASSAIGGYFGSLASDLSGKFKPAIQGMFDDLAKSTKIATGGTNALAGIITTLGTFGSHQLPRLAQGFVNVTKRFDDFLSRSAKNGALQDMFDNAIDGLKDLGRIGSGVFGIFSELYKAASAGGGTTLHSLADGLQSVRKSLAGAGVQKALTDVFKAAHDATHAMVTLAGPSTVHLLSALGKTATTIFEQVGITIGRLGGSIADALGSKAAQQGIKNLSGGIATMVRELAPVISKMGPAIRALATYVGNFAARLGAVLSQLLNGLAPVFTKLLNGLNPIVDTLSVGLRVAISDLMPLFGKMADAFLGFVKPIASQLGPAVHKVLPPLVDAFGKLLTTVKPIGEAIASLIGPAGDVLKVFAQLLDGVLTPIAPIIRGVAKAFQAIPGPIKSVALALGGLKLASGVLTSFGAGLAGRLRGTTSALSNMAAGFTNWAKQGITAARGLNTALSAGVVGGIIGSSVGGKGKGGLLEAAGLGALGGGLAGATVGGPFGIAIGAAVGAVGSLAAAWKKQSDAAKDSVKKSIGALEREKDSINDLLSSFEQNGDAFGKGFTAKYVGDLAKTDKIVQFNKAGIQMADVLNRIKFNTDLTSPAYLKFDKALSKALATGKISQATYNNLQKYVQGAGLAATEAEKRFILEQRALGKTIIPSNQLGVSMDRLKKAFAGSGTSLDQLSAAGRRNSEGIRENVEQVAKSTTAHVKNAKTALQAAGNFGKQTSALKDNLVQMGFNRAGVEKIISTYGKVPTKITTQLQKIGITPTQIQAIITKYHGIPAKLITDVTKKGVTPNEIEHIVNSYLGIPGVVRTKIEIETAAAKLAIKGIKDALAAIPKHVASNVSVGGGHLAAARDGVIVGARGSIRNGMVHGPGTGRSDTAGIFRLSNMEAVIPAAAVRQNRKLVEQLIRSGSHMKLLSEKSAATGNTTTEMHKHFQYYEAPGSHRGEESVFAAAKRARFEWWT